MPSLADKTTKQIKEVLQVLIYNNIVNKFHFPSSSTKANCIESIDFGKQDISIVLDKNKTYREIYISLCESESYTCELIDGGLIQLMYEFKNNTIIKHRLAFFSSPDFPLFPKDLDVLEEEKEEYSDFIANNIVAFPIRFDFDSEVECCNPILHPASHLTLGQYQNCRIPVSSPVTPYQFFDFILRNFYNTIFNKCFSKNHFNNFIFDDTITENEKKITHLKIAYGSI